MDKGTANPAIFEHALFPSEKGRDRVVWKS